MKRAVLLVISLAIFALFAARAAADNRGVEIANRKADKFMAHIVAEEYQAAYHLMDPITRRGITRGEFEKGLETLNATFGLLKSYTRERHEFGGFKFPGTDGAVPAIDFVYQGQMSPKSRAAAVTVTVTLIEKRVFVSYYDIKSTVYDMLR